MLAKGLALLGTAFLIAVAMPPLDARAATPAMHGAVATTSPLIVPVFHGHASRGTSAYCYPRNYWWFYRPYTTAADNHPRCMPYFHYPPEAYRGGRGRQGVK